MYFVYHVEVHLVISSRDVKQQLLDKVGETTFTKLQVLVADVRVAHLLLIKAICKATCCEEQNVLE